MVILILSFLTALLYVSGSKLVEYKFGSSFGQIFYDYSGYGNHGQNGDSLYQDVYDTIPTDRGAYFNSYDKHIYLPPNSKVSSPFIMGRSHSTLMWFYPIVNNYDFFITSRHYVGWSLLDLYGIVEQQLKVHINELPTPCNTYSFIAYSLSNYYLENWAFVAMINFYNYMVIYLNGVNLGWFSSSGLDYDSQVSHHFIGYTSSSFIGFFLELHNL